MHWGYERRALDFIAPRLGTVICPIMKRFQVVLRDRNDVR